MPKVSPIYSARTMDVHHDNSTCTERNNIERENVRQGTGGLPLCSGCSRRNAQGL